MKNLLLIMVLVCLCNFLNAQNTISKLEYYIDADPGYGLATDIAITPATDLDISFNPVITSLANGVHRLYVRGKDSNNKWSFSKCHSFYKGKFVKNQNITRVEYYFDKDPGYGKGSSLSFTPSKDVDISVNLDVKSLENGIHKLFVRAQDSIGQWTITQSHTFYKGIFSTGKPATITAVEYYFDTDPGFGNGKKVAFTAGSDLDLTFDADLSGLSDQPHTIFIRALDENGSWSLIHNYNFCFSPDKPTKPSGNVDIVKGTQNVQYSTSALANATGFVWSISPTSAGTITGTDIAATVNYSSSFTGVAKISVSGKNDCGLGSSSDTLTVNVKTSTSIEQTEFSNFRIYPNPSDGTFNLVLQSKCDKTIVEIINANGQIVYSKDYYQRDINESISLKQPKGIYMAKVTNGKDILYEKLIIGQ